MFYQYFIASNYRDCVPAPHIRVLADKLMKLALDGDGKHRLAVSMPPRHPISDDTPVFTSEGWKCHGDLKVGDFVLGRPHQFVEVVNVLPSVSVDNCLVFSNGDKIVCGDYHVWYLHDGVNNETRLFETHELMDRNLFLDNSYVANFKIPFDNKCISLIDAYKVDKVQGKCITVDSPDGMYLVGENFTPTHNSKSSMVTLAFPLWLLFQDPNVNIMIVTGSPKLAEKFGIQLREYVRELGKYFNVYLSNVKQASTHIMFCDKNDKLYKGNIMLASSGGGITGQDADYLILDDPYTGNDSELTPTALQNKIDWVNRVVEQRIEPHTKYCVLHTRWHPLHVETPVLTSNRGWVKHGELKKGDEVFTPKGTTTKVTQVYNPVPVNNCFEFANGDKIISGDHHLWKVYDNGNRKNRILETSQIMQRPTLLGNNRCNFLLDKIEPLQFQEQEVPIKPYWLGLWLGDGYSKQPIICAEERDVEYSLKNNGYEIKKLHRKENNCTYASYTYQNLSEKLKELNLINNKHIPELYLYNSVETRLELLAGLIDSDGCLEKSSNRVIFVNTDKKLLKNVYELITGLGFNVHVDERPAEKINKYKEKYNSPIRSTKDAYALRFTPHYSIPTRIPRKQIKGKGQGRRVGLIKTSKVETVPGNCITVESEDGLYLVGKNLTTTHNSNDIIGYYKTTDPDSYEFVEFAALDENNNPLWKERYSAEELLKKKEIVGERVFSSVYQQQPIDTTSDFFNLKRLKFGKPENYEVEESVRAWDIAASDNFTKNDFTAGVKMVKYKDYAIITDLVHGRFGNNFNQIMKSTALKDTPNTHILVETGVAAAGKLLFEEYCKQLPGYIVKRAEVTGNKNKADRATPFKNAIEDGKVYVDIEDPVLRDVFINELASFPLAEHDDIVDATSHCFNELFMDVNSNKVGAALGIVFL